MKIYFVRHGKTVWNLEGKIQGWENSELLPDDDSPERAAQEIKGINFDLVCSSDLKRAVITKERILNILGLDDEKMDYFELKVCSTKWLELSSKPILLRHTLIVDKYNYNDILRSIEYYISQCEDSSWKNISLKLSRYFLWEFEDYIEE